MPIAVKCSSCATRLNAPDTSAGKRVKCPKCGTGIAVPAAESDFEMVDDEPTPARPAKPVAARKPVDDDDDDDRPRKRRRDDDDDDDDRPRKKSSRSTDDDDDRPRKQGKRKSDGKKKGGFPVVLIAAIGGGVAVLAIVTTVLFVVFGGEPTGPGGILGPSTPAGYSVVGESAIGMKMFLPGEIKGSFVHTSPDPNSPTDPNHYTAIGLSGDPVGRMNARRTPGFKPGSSLDELYASAEKAPFIERPRKFEILEKKQVTLGGKQGLEYRMKELPDLWDDTPMNAEFFKDKNEKEKQRVAQEGKYYVVLVAVSNEWTYVVSIERKGKPVDDLTMKTVTDSITFN